MAQDARPSTEEPRLPRRPLLALGLLLVLGLALSGGSAEAEVSKSNLPDLVSIASFLDDNAIEVEDGRRLLYFASAIGNEGEAPFEIVGIRASPLAPMIAVQVVRGDQGVFGALAGTLEWEGGDHGHWHIRDIALYELLDADGEVVLAGRKEGFCLLNSRPLDPADRGSPVQREYYTCNDGPKDGLRIGPHGISAGWMDIYSRQLQTQYLDVTDLEPGEYVLRVTVDPEDRIAEAREDNNAAETVVEIPPAD